MFCTAVIQEAQVTLDCAVPRKHHGSIMGPKGHRIQEISKTHNVIIKIPDRNTEGTKDIYRICELVFFNIEMHVLLTVYCGVLMAI